MIHYGDNRSLLMERRADATSEAAYIKSIWDERYPDPAPKASAGWSFRRYADDSPRERIVRALEAAKPSNVRAIRGHGR